MKSSLRLMACILAIIMILSLVSCNNTSEAQSSHPTSSSTGTSATTKKSSNTTQSLQPEWSGPLFEEDIKNLIIIIGDGMGPEHIEAGQLIENKTYDFTKWNSSLCNTNSLSVLTDSAAAATALATGTLTKNKYVGKDSKGNDLETILDLAQENNKSVGIVTTDYLYGATPAGFSAHSGDRENSEEITLSQIDSGVDFLCGLRSDSFYEDYITTIEKFNIHYATSLSDEASILASDRVFLPIDIENGASGAVELNDAASMAIEYLERDTDGFVLMIEQAHIDKHSHNNKIEKMLECMKSLNETVETVMEWVGDRDDTAVIVTADHETGGLSVSKTADYPKSYPQDNPILYYEWKHGNHTQTMVNIFVYGVDLNFAYISQYKTADKIKNTDVFVLMKEILKFE